jgi:hypothetical protein
MVEVIALVVAFILIFAMVFLYLCWVRHTLWWAIFRLEQSGIIKMTRTNTFNPEETFKGDTYEFVHSNLKMDVLQNGWRTMLKEYKHSEKEILMIKSTDKSTLYFYDQHEIHVLTLYSTKERKINTENIIHGQSFYNTLLQLNNQNPKDIGVVRKR